MTNELFFTKNKVAPCVENDISLQTAKANKKKEKDFSKSGNFLNFFLTILAITYFSVH